MTFKEFLESGKRGRIVGNKKNNPFGTVVEEEGVLIFKSQGKPDKKLSVLSVLSAEWELERLPRTFYLGVTKIQSHMNVRELLQAVETPDNEPPKGKPMDNGEWIKVVEVLE